jgi:hypothetical protein
MPLRKHRLPLAISGALALAALVLLAQAFLQLSQRGYPYEAWDEIATSNIAAVRDGPARYRVYAYGSLDTSIHELAQYFSARFTATGRSTVRHSFSNNVPSSLDNPSLMQGPKTWAGLEYNYFRGLNYRDSIFIARTVYVAAVLALCGILGALAIYFFGTLAPPLLFSSLLLMTAPPFVAQAPQALPNAINCLLVAAMFLAAMAAVMQARPRLFVAAAILFPLALNMKIDVALFGIFLAAAYAASLHLAGASLRASAVLSGKLLAVFLVVFAISRPGILFNPSDEWAIQRNTLAILSSSENMLQLNFSIFRKFLEEGFFSMAAMTIGPALFLLLLAMQRDYAPRKKLLIGVLALLALAILWAGPVLMAAKLYPRYFLNGAGVFTVILGLAIVLGLRQPGTLPRILGFALLAVVCGITLARLMEVHDSGRNLAEAHARTEGLDPAYSRNRASLEVVRLIRQGKYPPEVLVDQHSYTDLGIFAKNGIKPTYVNARNFEDIFRGIAKPTLLLYAPANGYPPQDRRWFATTVNWEGYVAALQRLPKLAEIAGNVMDTLSYAPVHPDDGIVIAEAGGSQGHRR